MWADDPFRIAGQAAPARRGYGRDWPVGAVQPPQSNLGSDGCSSPAPMISCSTPPGFGAVRADPDGVAVARAATCWHAGGVAARERRRGGSRRLAERFTSGSPSGRARPSPGTRGSPDTLTRSGSGDRTSWLVSTERSRFPSTPIGRSRCARHPYAEHISLKAAGGCAVCCRRYMGDAAVVPAVGWRDIVRALDGNVPTVVTQIDDRNRCRGRSSGRINRFDSLPGSAFSTTSSVPSIWCH